MDVDVVAFGLAVLILNAVQELDAGYSHISSSFSKEGVSLKAIMVDKFFGTDF